LSEVIIYFLKGKKFFEVKKHFFFEKFKKKFRKKNFLNRNFEKKNSEIFFQLTRTSKLHISINITKEELLVIIGVVEQQLLAFTLLCFFGLVVARKKKKNF